MEGKIQLLILKIYLVNIKDVKHYIVIKQIVYLQRLKTYTKLIKINGKKKNIRIY